MERPQILDLKRWGQVLRGVEEEFTVLEAETRGEEMEEEEEDTGGM